MSVEVGMSLEDRIGRLEAVRALSDVMATYAWAVDEKDINLLLTLIADDVSYRIEPRTDEFVEHGSPGGIAFSGKQRFRDFYQASFDQIRYMKHNISNIYVEVNGDEAYVRSYYVGETVTDDHGDEVTGIYHFTFRLTAGRWCAYDIVLDRKTWTGRDYGLVT